MTDDRTVDLKAGRMRVPRSRGAVGGALLIVGGLVAGLVPFIGPYGNLAYTPSPNTTWKWTAARGWLEVLPGAVAVVAGLLLIASTHRIAASFAGWLGVAAGAWLIVGPALAEPLSLDIGTPDPNQTAGIRATEEIVFFFGIGAAILLVAGLTLGRLSVHSVRDVQVAERRAAEEAERRAEEIRFAQEHRIFTQQQAERDRLAAEEAERNRLAAEEAERNRLASAPAEYAPPPPADTTDRIDMDKPDSSTSSADESTDSAVPRSERQRDADERFAAERARIAEEQSARSTDGTDHQPVHAMQQPADDTDTPGQPEGDYPPFYGNRG